MKALIFNSGLGRRLEEYTADKPKALVRLSNGETILHRQLRLLYSCGVREYVITTGPYAEQIVAETTSFIKRGAKIDFVHNPEFETTNYIYSMYLAREYLKNDNVLLLHGDLVFDARYIQMVIDSNLPSIGSVNPSIPLPEKDFKSRVIDGEVREVSVDIFDKGCMAFQPLYKLSRSAMAVWLCEVQSMVEAGKKCVYAEQAANNVLEQMHIKAFSYEDGYVEEIDTPDDLMRVSLEIRKYDFAQQPVYISDGDSLKLVDGLSCAAFPPASCLVEILHSLHAKRPFVPATSHFHKLNVSKELDGCGIDYTLFADFHSNPSSEDVDRACELYRDHGCDSVLSVGGGSAIDIGKCVKWVISNSGNGKPDSLMGADLCLADIPHIAVPTTAGTGSESTHFAVCYVQGEKVSIANDGLQPSVAILDQTNLASLSDYQKKCTMLDALCQAVESYWSVKSCQQSRRYAADAISLIIENIQNYFAKDPSSELAFMLAANYAGKAINLTTTTAPHAMSYKLTSLYGVPHGHAVAMCMPQCWKMLINRGDDAIRRKLLEIASIIIGGVASDPEDGLNQFEKLFNNMQVAKQVSGSEGDIALLTSSVNTQRLRNFPIELSKTDIEYIYRSIVIEKALLA